MRRSERHLDHRIEQLVAGSGGADDDPMVRFAEALRTEARQARTTAPELANRLAEMVRVSPGPSISSRRGAAKKPLPRRWRRRAMIGTFLSTLLAKLLVASVALAATASGLAATGTLPDPAQQWAADLLKNVGIEIPNPAEIAGRRDANLPEDAVDPAEKATGHCTEEHPDEAVDCEVLDRVFEGDPTQQGADYGRNVADTADSGGDDNSGTGAGDEADVADDHRP